MAVVNTIMKILLLPCLATALFGASCHAFTAPTRCLTTARPASLVGAPRLSSSLSTDNKMEEKKRRQAKASESIFLKLFGFASPSPASMVLVVPAIAFGIRDVPIMKVVFSLAFPMYLGILNRFRFDLNKPAKNKPVGSLLKRGGGDWYDNYHNFCGLFSALIPTAFCFAAPQSVLVKPAVTYSYLSLMQYVWETLCRSPDVHVLLRLLIPISFNSMRLLSVVDWMRMAIPAYDVSKSANLGTHFAHIFGITLGVANAALLAYNLFGLLLPRILPQYLDQNEYPTADVKWIGQVLPVIE